MRFQHSLEVKKIVSEGKSFGGEKKTLSVDVKSREFDLVLVAMFSY